jgi:hypothetical protein
MRKLNVNIFASSKPDSLDWANQFNLVSHITIGVLGWSNADCHCSGRRLGHTNSAFAIESATPLFGGKI